MSANLANVKKWTDALRSGEYKQGQGQLREADTYCCLGVLCDVSQVGAWEGRSEDFTGYATNYTTRTGSNPAAPPAEVNEWLGTPLGNITAEVEGTLAGLWRLNDYYRLNFNQIADVIDQFFGLKGKR